MQTILILSLILQIYSKPTSLQQPMGPVLLESVNSPWDADEIPSSINDSGDNYYSGSTYFLLVTTFIEDDPGSGKLWVVPVDQKMREYSYEIIVGLDRPTGSCFDVNHNFLYIVDNGFNGTGYIYQYEIAWDADEEFILSRDVYAIVYEGVKPFDCKIDKYGNMFFLEAEYDTINIISYLDLYSGFTNMNYTIYSSDPYVSYPVSLDVINSEDIYYSNHYNGDEVGSVVRADAKTEYINGGEVDILVKNVYRTWGVTHTKKNLVFFALDNGDIWTVNDNNPNKLNLKNQNILIQPRGMSYGDHYVYVAEYANGTIWRFNDNIHEEMPQMIIRIEGAYSVFCVSFSKIIMVLLVGYIL